MKKTMIIVSIGTIAMIAVSLGCKNNVRFIPNNPINYNKVQLTKWVNNYYAEIVEPNYKDNEIYTECLEIWFQYNYEKNGEVKFFAEENINEWVFVDEATLENGIGVKYIKLESRNPNEYYDNPPQSAISYELFNSNNEIIGNETTGVVENYKNIVLHNPRPGFFKSLFSFPWPSIKFPMEDNRAWKWNFSYSSEVFGDDRFFNWDGITEMNYDYTYIGETKLNLAFGDVVTSKYEAIGTDGIIKNKLIYYFNNEIGFVKQEFYTHDGAKVVLEAVDYINKCE